MRYSKTKTRTVAISAIAVALLALACSSGGEDSGATTAAPASVSAAMVEPSSTTVPPETTTTTTAAAAETAAEGLPAAPGTETEGGADGSSAASSTTTSSAAASTTAASVPTVDPETPEDPETSATSEPPVATTTTTTASPPPTSTATTVAPPAALQVQVLNGSGVAGAAGRMTARLSEAGFVVLPPGNAPQRYASSAVYYADGWQDEAEEILETAGIDEIEEVTAMPAVFASEDAAVVVLLGRDTAPAIAREQSGLRPRPNFDVTLPLGDDVPRDRFVPGLADIQIYTRQNDENPTVLNYTDNLQRWLGYVANYREDDAFGVWAPDRGSYEDLLAVYASIEEALAWLGFTPQNVCGAPAGYSFTDLLKPTREFSEEAQSYRGDAILTTDRLIELHGGERINPEANLEFYISQAVQTAYDALRSAELLDETEAPQLILCEAWISPSGELPEYANALWYALLTPGVQPRESLLSQGTYHVKEISRNGNLASIVVCHPTLGVRYLLLHWRDGGYRAELVTSDLVERTSGCQAVYEVETYIYEDTGGTEDTIRYSFGDRAFAASDLLGFPRS